MRFGVFVISALAAVLFSVPAIAQSVPVCQGIELVSPAAGKHFLGSRPIFFRWSGEPVGTISRELHLAALDGSETVVPLDGRFSDTVRVRMTGDLAWAVVFLDANGTPICTTPIGLLAAGPGGGTAGASGSSLSNNSGAAATPPAVPAPRLVVGFTNNGRLVIVLQNTPYTGQYSKLVAADSYDLTTEDLMGAMGVELHGNNSANVLKGSPGKDLIYAYGGADTLDGGAGDDLLHGGSGNDQLRDPVGGDADILYGGDDVDSSNLTDGDPNDRAYYDEPGIGGDNFDSKTTGDGDNLSE
jgi:Ca2+-binding RTX toxin-like protein